MKSALPLTLAVCLVGSAIPATAQERTGAAGPIVRAITREAVRLAAAGEPAGIETVRQGGTRDDSDWSRVRKLAPGAEIIVTVKGSPPGQRYFVAGDEFEVMVLNVANPTLPRAARDVLRDVASNHPEYLLALRRGGTVVLKSNVRIAPDGLFVGGQKVADLQQAVETIVRTDVAEIKTSPKQLRQWRTAAGGTAGAAAGFLIGLVALPGRLTCNNSDTECNLGPLANAMIGSLAGGSIGGVLGRRADRAAAHETNAVIYRAP